MLRQQSNVGLKLGGGKTAQQKYELATPDHNGEISESSTVATYLFEKARLGKDGCGQHDKAPQAAVVSTPITRQSKAGCGTG